MKPLLFLLLLLPVQVNASELVNDIESKLRSFNDMRPQDCRSPLIHDTEQMLNKQLDNQPHKDTYQWLFRIADSYREANCLVNAKRVYQGLLNSSMHYQAQLGLNELEQ